MILVVDDERNLADTLVEMLRLIGQTAIAAYSAEQALVVLRDHEPALILCDVVMPGANGIELAVEARRLRPNVGILLLSGNAATQELVEGARAAGHVFELLAKPVPPKQLLMKVLSLLNEQLTAEHSNAAIAG